MKKPILVVMAAGMGSRYGGLKQIDPAMVIYALSDFLIMVFVMVSEAIT